MYVRQIRKYEYSKKNSQQAFRLTCLVKQFLGDGQMSQVVLDGGRVVLQQGVRVAERVASLESISSISFGRNLRTKTYLGQNIS
jgi:hypothetical protein